MGTETARRIWETSHRSRCARMVRPFLGGRDAVRGPPRFVKDGPVFENVLRGDDIDVLKFPAPQWHPLDGGRYLGTGVCDVLKDPDSDWINVGTYRVQVQDRDHVSVYISPGKHGRQFRDEYFKRKQPCPIAIVIGGEPLPFIASSLEIPYCVS